MCCQVRDKEVLMVVKRFAVHHREHMIHTKDTLEVVIVVVVIECVYELEESVTCAEPY